MTGIFLLGHLGSLLCCQKHLIKLRGVGVVIQWLYSCLDPFFFIEHHWLKKPYQGHDCGSSHDPDLYVILLIATGGRARAAGAAIACQLARGGAHQRARQM